MNVTPFIDVLLVLLIIFMVMPHHRGEKADIPMPDRHPPQHTIVDNIVIQLHDSGYDKIPKLTINKQDVAWDALEKELREIYVNRADTVAFLKGDPEIDFQYVADTLDIARHAGVDRVGLMGGSE
jgi:biopolymer transport protein ExbD